MNPKRRVRILMVAACPFPSLRGSQALIRGLCEQLSRAGHDVHVATYPVAQHTLPLGNAVVHRVRHLPGLSTIKPLGWQKALIDLLLLGTALRIVRKERIEVIHAHNFEGAIIGIALRMLTGVPVVYHAHNALGDELPRYFLRQVPRRLAKFFGNIFDSVVSSAVDHVVAPFDRLAAFFSARNGIGRVSVVLPNIVPVRVREDVGSDGFGGARDADFPLIMYAGNVDPYQDLDVLLTAHARVRTSEPTARLVIVTHPPSYRQVSDLHDRLAGHAGVSVEVVSGAVAMLRTLKQADLLVCPRGSWSGFPIKVLNYMSLGRPILQARSSAHAIEGGVTGLIFSDGDAFSLANLLLSVVRNPSSGRDLGIRCMQVAREKYAGAVTLKAISEVYERVLRERSPQDRNDQDEAGNGEMTQREDQQMGRRMLGGAGLRQGGRIRMALLGVLAMTIAACAPRPHADIEPAPLPPLAVKKQIDFSDEYRLLPGDELRVKYTFHPEYDIRVTVAPDGTISLQDIGVVKAEGRTPRELGKEIERLSSVHLREPVVAVLVAELGPHKVYVGGEVRNPGFVYFRPGMTPLQAILDRGGFTDTARSDSVLKVTNYAPLGPQSTRLDFSGTLKEGDPEAVALQVADVLYVPSTWIGDANDFVRLYIRNMLPIDGKFSVPAVP